jgi:hypothetical protein
MLTFAAAVVGVAATVGCGDASVGEMPSPILTAPPRPSATLPVAVAAWQVSADGSGSSFEGNPESEVRRFESDTQPTLPPVPTAMVAATVRKNRTVETQGVEQWRPLVESIFPAFAVETMLRVVRCESSGNPAAHNENPASGDDSVGLAQVNLHASLLPGRIALLQSLGYEAYDRDSAVAILMDPEANLRAAYRISAGGTSWGAWTCR